MARTTANTFSRIVTVSRRSLYTSLVILFLCVEAPVIALILSCLAQITIGLTDGQATAVIEAGCTVARSTVGYAVGCGA